MPTMLASRASFGNRQRVPALAKYFCHGSKYMWCSPEIEPPGLILEKHYRPEHAFSLAVHHIRSQPGHDTTPRGQP